VADFKLHAPFEPRGDQPEAIAALTREIRAGRRWQTLLGVTGSGKTFTMANVIAELGMPALIFSHNKTLAAQLYGEFKGFFPENAVEYFISYYDYYQPEAFIPSTGTYIEKDVSINDEIERLRLRATSSLMSRRDVVVVASVSAIYGLGNPETFHRNLINLKTGQIIDRDVLLQRLVDVHYARQDVEGKYGTFRVRGDTVEIRAAFDERVLRVEFFGDEIERLSYVDGVSGRPLHAADDAVVYPARQFVTERDQAERILDEIGRDLEIRLGELDEAGKPLEAQRLASRTRYDMEMIRQVGYCNGVENYSRYFDGREPGDRPACLLDYFPDDYLLIIDESHVTVSQLAAMYRGDRSRKETLVEHGFRLPSAMDNRPLRFEEFTERIGQTVYSSATPGPYEISRSDGIVEQIIRPTGLVDPEVIVKPTKGQIDDLMGEIRERVERDERVLVTTLTKKMAEDLTDYLMEHGVRTRYLHSEVDTLRRVELLRELRLGDYDVLVGINLLREGLDLPEVSLVAILDADKEGFLRSERSLIQTIGRAARNVSGQVHMYADQMTSSMSHAIDETNRRRAKQVAYNTAHGIDPQPLRKRIADITDLMAREDADTERWVASRQGGGRTRTTSIALPSELRDLDAANLPATELAALIQELTAQMHQAASELQFELAARLRDEVADLKKELRQMVEATR